MSRLSVMRILISLHRQGLARKAVRMRGGVARAGRTRVLAGLSLFQLFLASIRSKLASIPT